MRQQLKAYLVALAIFAVLTTGENLYLKYHPLMTGDDTAIFIFNLERLLAIVAPGYVAALMIHRNGLLSGMTAGLLVGGAFALYRLIMWSVIGEWYGALLWGAVLGGIGGLLWSLQALVMRFTKAREQIK